MRPVLNSTTCANFIAPTSGAFPGPLPAGGNVTEVRACQHPYRYGIPGALDGSDRIGGQAEFCGTPGQLEFGMHAQLRVRMREMTFYRALAEE
jgi:hypothetical protein